MSFRLPLVSVLCFFLSAAAGFSREDPSVEGEVIVTFQPTVGEARVKLSAQRHALREVRRFDRLSKNRKRVLGVFRSSGRRTRELIRDLSGDPSIERVEPNYLRRISAATVPGAAGNPLFWGLENLGQTVNSVRGVSGIDVKFSPAWKLSKPLSGPVVVAVVDTGVDIGHRDLAANIFVNPGEIPDNGTDDDGNGYVDDVHGYDFVNRSGKMTDSGTHGTHVAGTIAAGGGHDPSVLGVHPFAKILPLKVSADGETMSTSAILAAFDYVVRLKESGVNVVAVNASYGGVSSTRAERSAIEALRDAGILLCAAAGNEGNDNDLSAAYPASYPTSNIIAVAAIGQSGELAGFSNFGAASVDIAAPGVNIWSSLPGSSFRSRAAVAGESHAAAAIEFAGETPLDGLQGVLINCGIGNPQEFPATVRGQLALIRRGTLTFADKVQNAAAAGALGAIIYDNLPGSTVSGGWTMGTSGPWIPAIGISADSGAAILAALNSNPAATIWNHFTAGENRGFQQGTSMAAPHVSGAVAFAAWNYPDESWARRMERILAGAVPLPDLKGKVATGGMISLLGIVDSDGNGLPDYWEAGFPAGFPGGAHADADGDGFPNRQEFYSGTDPMSATGRPGFTGISHGAGPSGKDLILSFIGSPALRYEVEFTDNPATQTWQPMGAPVVGTGELMDITDQGALGVATRRFYRLRLEEN